MSTVKVIDVNLRGSLFRVGLSFVFRISKVVFYLFRYFIFLIVVKKHAALPMFLCHSSVFVGMVFCHASLLLMVLSYVHT